MVGSMSAEEKLRAVQLWNILSEKLQEIVNNSAADINALAFPSSQEQVPAAAITTSAVPPSLFFYPAPSKTPSHNAPAEDVSETNFTSAENQQQQQQEHLSKSPLRSMEADNSLASFSDIQCADDESIHMDGVCPLNLPLPSVDPSSEINPTTEPSSLIDVDKEKNKQFECGECGVSFRTKGHLLDHSRKHTGNIWHLLSLVVLFKLNNLLLFLFIGERPFQCNQCTSSFTTGSNLKRHGNSIHHDTCTCIF